MARLLTPRPPTVAERMLAVRALVCDVDGVLTDGCLHYLGDEELKSFSVLDGFGLRLAREAGWRVALLTARGGAAVERRARELEVELVSGEPVGKLDSVAVAQPVILGPARSPHARRGRRNRVYALLRGSTQQVVHDPG